MFSSLKAMLKRRIRNAVGYAELQETIIQKLKQLESINAQTRSHKLSKSIFIVGHGRSGTTVLLRALSSSPDIYLLGEANLYLNIGKNDFSSWYNAMHAEFKNKPEKSTYCPKINMENATGWHVLEYLSRYFKYIGEKVAFSDQSGNQKDFFDFSLSNFIDGHYLCVIRHPVDVIASSIIGFYNANFNDEEKISSLIKSIYRTYDLIISIHKTFPNAYIITHENIQKDTFDYLSKRLSVNLQRANALYKQHKQNKYEKYAKQITTHKLYTDLFSFHTYLVSCIDHNEYIYGNQILLNELHRKRNIL